MQEQTKTWSAQDWIMRGKTRRSGRNKTTTKCGGRRPDAPDWNILGRTCSRGRRPPDWSIRGQLAATRPGRVLPGQNKKQGLPPPNWIIRGQAAAERHRLDDPGRIKRQEPPQPRLDHPGTWGGQTPCTGTFEVVQAAGSNAPMTRKSTETWRADAPDWKIGGRTRRSCHDPRGRGKMVCRPGQDSPGRIRQKGSPPPGLERPGESGGQKGRKQEAETKVVQRRTQARKKRKGQHRGDAERQRSGQGPGVAGQQG